MSHRFSLVLACLAALALQPAAAQDVDVSQIRRNIEVFSGVLEEALELNESSGLFGISLGGVQSTYLAGQGIVMEIRSPLANRRNRLSLASLSSTMQSLSARGNPFEAMRRASATAAPPDPSQAQASPADSFYRDMMDRIANIDFSLIVNTAIQQASDSAQSLRSLGELDAGAYQQLQGQINNLRQRMHQGLADLRELEAEVRQAGAADSATADSESRLSGQLGSLLTRIEPLREEALATAADLKARTEAAERRYAENWQRELLDFEQSLYVAMCDFGASLRALPDDERVSIILKGLGEDTDDNRRTDKVHVFSKADIGQCQSGAIDVATLRDRSSEYSY